MDAVAVHDDREAIVAIDQALAAGADFNSDSATPLALAVTRPTTAVLEHLLALGAKPSAEDDFIGLSALHWAAEAGRADSAALLIAADGPAILDRFSSPFGRTALCEAAAAGRLEVAALLLKSGADVDRCDASKAADSPLAEAVEQKHVELVRLLLAHGADPDAKGWMQITPRMRAREACSPEIDRLLADAPPRPTTA